MTGEATVRSTTNVLRLVLMLGERGRLRVTSVAEELGVAPSTAHRLLTALTQAGFAVQDDDRVYVPGPAYVRLRVPASHPDALVALVAPFLHDLVLATGETTHLMIMERTTTTVRFIHSVEGTAVLRVASRTGAVIPAHLTSGGKALLARMTDDEVRALYVDGLPGGTRANGRTLDQLLTELTSIRASGIAQNHEESEAGISAIGIAFQRHSLSAAISVSMPTTRYRGSLGKTLKEHLRRTAHKIEAQP